MSKQLAEAMRIKRLIGDTRAEECPISSRVLSCIALGMETEEALLMGFRTLSDELVRAKNLATEALMNACPHEPYKGL